MCRLIVIGVVGYFIAFAEADEVDGITPSVGVGDPMSAIPWPLNVFDSLIAVSVVTNEFEASRKLAP